MSSPHDLFLHYRKIARWFERCATLFLTTFTRTRPPTISRLSLLTRYGEYRGAPSINLRAFRPVFVSITEHDDAYLHADLVDMTIVLLRAAMAVRFGRLAHKSGLFAHVLLAHLSFNFVLWCECSNGINDDTSTFPSYRLSTISRACSPVSGCEMRSSGSFRRFAGRILGRARARRR